MLDLNIIIIQNLCGNLYFCDNCFFIATHDARFAHALHFPQKISF